MANATATPTSSDVWDDGKRIHVIGTIAVTASPNVYVTGGLALDLLTQLVDGAGLGQPLPGVVQQPNWFEIHGKAGFKYEWDYTNKKLIIRDVGTITPSGTVQQATFTGTAMGTHSHQLHFQTSAAANAVTAASNQLRTAAAAFNVAGVANTSGEGGVVDISAGTPAGTINAQTFTGSATTDSALTEIPASAIPPGVSGDTIKFHAIFRKLA